MGLVVKVGAAHLTSLRSMPSKRALIAAKSVACIDPNAGGSSGIYFDKLIQRLGIAIEVRAKAKLKQRGYVAELVASGEDELGISPDQ